MTADLPHSVAPSQRSSLRLLLLLLAAVVQAFVNCGGNTTHDLASEPGASAGGETPSGEAGAPASYPDYWECFDAKDCPAGEFCPFGRCVHFEDCEPSTVNCRAAKPACPLGFVPRVEAGCWGECVRVESCGDLRGCGLCYEQGMLCATLSWSGTSYKCAAKPLDCGPTSCACGGQEACGTTHCSAFTGDMVSCFGAAFLPGQCCDVMYSPLCDQYDLPDPADGCF